MGNDSAAATDQSAVSRTMRSRRSLGERRYGNTFPVAVSRISMKSDVGRRPIIAALYDSTVIFFPSWSSSMPVCAEGGGSEEGAGMRQSHTQVKARHEQLPAQGPTLSSSALIFTPRSTENAGGSAMLAATEGAAGARPQAGAGAPIALRAATRARLRSISKRLIQRRKAGHDGVTRY